MKTRKTIFVSGGAGVIGQQLVPILVELGHEVIVGDLKEKPNSFTREVKFLQGDLNNLSAGEFKELHPNIFIHLAAAFERIEESQGFWGASFQHNVKLSHHLMTLVNSCDSVERVLYASSYLVYDPALYLGNSVNGPFRLLETSQLGPRNLIGASKMFHEGELAFLQRLPSTSFSIVIPRIFRGYGLNSRDVISRWVRAAVRGETINAFDLEGSFDYIYCKDSANGIAKLSLETNLSGVVNLGSGQSRKVSEVVELLKLHFPNLKVSTLPSKRVLESSQADISKLENTLHWKPTFSLEESLREIVDYETKIYNSPTSHA